VPFGTALLFSKMIYEMKSPKHITELQDLVNEFSLKGVGADDEEFSAFRKRGTTLISAILRQDLNRDALEQVDALIRQYRSVEGINLLAKKIQSDPELFDDEFDYIEEKVQEITNEKWLAYRQYPISESPNHGLMMIMFLEKKPDQPWIYYLSLNKFKRLGDPLDPKNPLVPTFVRSMIIKSIDEAMKDIKTTEG